MPSGNEVTVSVSTPSPVTVTVPGSVGSSPTVTNGGTANVTVTSVGDRGPKGDAGPANSLAIGQVITGAAGSSASATISGTPPNQTILLTIPRGEAGVQGPAGSFADAQGINARTASYTLLLEDAGKLITASHASSAIVVAVPNNSVANFPVGTHIDIARLGDGEVSVSALSGVTVNATPGLKLRARYSSATLIQVAANSWLLVGDLAS